ncbi:MAG: aldehyde dehydrogenase family protein, partial [Candidatus Binatia bacterium]|nr:aldehyde dehydrogenase family protein [Candidatus Binatia bacterium]
HTSAVLAKFRWEYLDLAAISLVVGGADETAALLAERFDYVFCTDGGRVGRHVFPFGLEHR